MDGVQLCARFSIATSRREYCGPAGASSLLERAVTEGEGLDEAREALSRFEALMPYLEAIGGRHGLDPFDARVVEAYWMGNDLLDAFRKEDFLHLLETLVRRGLPRSVASELARRLPEGAIPHHAFHVAFVGVGAVTGHVETTLGNMEECRPALAQIVGIEGRSLVARKPRLTWVGGALTLSNPGESRVTFDERFLPGIRVGDPVVLHWGWPCLKPEAAQADRLERYTARALALASPAFTAAEVVP
ncbi:MAG: DUF6390 family protein [Thermoplasmata archaeon]|nr:DUF6390 family protein [Thermoplasmata archaeon]